jgi:hypothetical protein
MNRFTRTITLTVALLALCFVPAARAEVIISITISGSIEELLPILRQLQNMGVGTGDSAEDPLKLNVHSIMSGDDVALPGMEPAPAPVEPVPEPEPAKLGFQGASATPGSAKAGENVLFTAQVSDPGHVVDTVGLTVGDITFDLFDNGANGDEQAMDGVWSRLYALPATLPAGEHVATITAYDVNGETVVSTEEGKEPVAVVAEAPFVVVE